MIYVRKIMKSGETYIISLPKELMRKFGWKKGDPIRVIITDHEIILKRFEA